MNTNRQLFYRIIVTTVMVMLALVVVMPAGHPARAQIEAATSSSDDFNRCSLDTSFWTVENLGSIQGATSGITGQYTGDSQYEITIPAGTSYTWSSKGRTAPVIWHPVVNANLDYEVSFLAPMNEPTAGLYKIAGILARDNTNPAAPKYFRFDFNSSGNELNRYLGYIANDTLTHIVNVETLQPSPTSGTLNLGVNYDKASTTWTITHHVGANQIIETFLGSTYDTNFTVTDLGLFVGSTVTSGITPPGNNVKVDYFRNMADASFSDDAVMLTVQKAGAGSGSVDFPVTNPSQCSGSLLTLTAKANAGSVFGGWSGAFSGTQTTATVDMASGPKSLIATFTLGTLPDLNNHVFLPLLTK